MPTTRIDNHVLKAALLLCDRNKGATSMGSIVSFTGLDDEAVNESLTRLERSGVLRRRNEMTVIGRVCYVSMPGRAECARSR